MTSRVSYAPQDVQKMCKQAERDLEAKKLVLLMDRVKRQIAAHERSGMQGGKPSLAALDADSRATKLPSRSLPLER